MATVFLNGKFVEVRDAAVSAFDAGLTHGVGLFETMVGGAGGAGAWVFLLGDHMERLARSAAELGMSDSLRKDALGDAVLETVRRCGLARARVRLTVTGGAPALPGEPASAGVGNDPTLLIVAQPATQYPEGMFERGVAVTIADGRANPLNPMEGHKTLNYWWRLRELRAAGAKGAAEAIVLGITNHICGGCVSNLWIVRGEELVTPIAKGEEGKSGSAGEGESGRGKFLPSPVLPGITRQWVLDEARRRGMAVKREMLGIADVLEADEVFLTNSSWGVLPVVKIEASAIADAVPGKITTSLHAAWRQAVEQAAQAA